MFIQKTNLKLFGLKFIKQAKLNNTVKIFENFPDIFFIHKNRNSCSLYHKPLTAYFIAIYYKRKREGGLGYARLTLNSEF